MVRNIGLKSGIALVAFFCATLLSWGEVQAQSGAAPFNNTVYEIFVRSFYDSNGDGIGDLRGLTQTLDYLNDGNPGTDNDLEIGIIWLMPIFPSVSYHGYNVSDYRKIHPEYGSLVDFESLIKASHERGIRIILDIPFNHTSNQHPWFRDAVQNPLTSPYRDYYHLVLESQPQGNGWRWIINDSGEKISYFGDFGYDMPDLNLANENVRDEVKEIAKFWLERGADGFRLDAAKHVFAWSDPLNWEEIQKNNAWWREFSESVYSVKPDAVIVGEVLASQEMIHHFAWGLDGLLDLHFMHRIREFTRSPYTGLVGWWKNYLAHARENKPSFNLFPYVSSHDEDPRFASFLKDHLPQRSEPAYRIAMYLLLTMGRYPILYYGDELMQEGWKWNGANPPQGDGSHIYDETLREPFPWHRERTGPGQTTWFGPRFDRADDGVSVKEQSIPESMLSLVRAMTNFRAENKDFADGEIDRILNDTANWVVFEKQSANSTYLTLINTSDMGHDYRFHDLWHAEYRGARLMFWADGILKRWEDTSTQQRNIDVSVYVPPFGLVILKRQ
jgi:alpha-amylase